MKIKIEFKEQPKIKEYLLIHYLIMNGYEEIELYADKELIETIFSETFSMLNYFENSGQFGFDAVGYERISVNETTIHFKANLE